MSGAASYLVIAQNILLLSKGEHKAEMAFNNSNFGVNKAGQAVEITARQKNALRSLMTAIIVRSLEDLRGVSAMAKKSSRNDIDGAMSFFNGSDCEAFCLELGIGYEELREEARELYRGLILGQGNGPLFYNELSTPGRVPRSCPGPITLKVS
jgi:hypothetical protein